MKKILFFLFKIICFAGIAILLFLGSSKIELPVIQSDSIDFVIQELNISKNVYLLSQYGIKFLLYSTIILLAFYALFKRRFFINLVGLLISAGMSAIIFVVFFNIHKDNNYIFYISGFVVATIYFLVMIFAGSTKEKKNK